MVQWIMDAQKANWNYFTQTYPEAAAAHQSFSKALHETAGPLDERTRALIKIGVAVGVQVELALHSHFDRAMKVGCSPAEIEHAIVITATTVGFPRMMDALRVWRDERAHRGL